MRLLLRGSLLVLLVAALAGTTAWWLVHDDPPVYERTLSFVTRPSALLDDGQIPDAVRGLSDQDAQLVNTIAGVMGSPRLLRSAALQSVGTERAEAIAEEYELSTAIRPGTDIIEATLAGADRATLASLGEGYASVAADWVANTYRAYRIEFLDADAPEEPVSPNVGRDVTLAALLGALFGVGALLAERKAREARMRVRAPDERPAPSEPRVIASIDDFTGRTDQLEETLRSHLQDGEAVVRVGPSRFSIVAGPKVTRSGRRSG